MNERQGEKAAIRAEVLERRAVLTAGERAHLSRQICGRIEELPAFATAGVVLFYMPVRGEVDVLPLLRQALKQGKACAIPRCVGNDLEFYCIRYLDTDVEPGLWGIPEPKLVPENRCVPGSDSVIIMPGAAYGRNGARIGYGAGYYDRFLRSLPLCPATIAPAYGFQVYISVPQQPWDLPVDCIVTETETIVCHKGEEHP